MKDNDVLGVEGSRGTSGRSKQRPRAPPGVQQRDNILDNLVTLRPVTILYAPCCKGGGS